MLTATVSSESLVRSRRFDATEGSLTVRVTNPDRQRAAEYEVAYFVDGRATRVEYERLEAGEWRQYRMLAGGEVVNTGRTDISISWEPIDV
jgi:hypothetical protein